MFDIQKTFDDDKRLRESHHEQLGVLSAKVDAFHSEKQDRDLFMDTQMHRD